MVQRLLFVAQRPGRRKKKLIIARTITMHSGNICRKGTFSIKFLDFLYIKYRINKELLCPFSENAMCTYQYLFTNPPDRKKT